MNNPFTKPRQVCLECHTSWQPEIKAWLKPLCAAVLYLLVTIQLLCVAASFAPADLSAIQAAQLGVTRIYSLMLCAALMWLAKRCRQPTCPACGAHRAVPAHTKVGQAILVRSMPNTTVKGS
jgi:hypothetical protein